MILTNISRQSLIRLALIVAAAIASVQVNAQQDVVGSMGAQQVRAGDLKRIIDAQTPEVRRQLATDLGALDRLVRSELVRQAIVAEARQKKWDKRPDVQLLMERAREQALITSYVNELARPAANYPSDAEIRGYYEATKGSLTTPAEYQLAQIFVAVPDGSDKVAEAAAQKKAADLAARVQRSPGDFAQVARENSDHKESAAKGGDLGWVPETQLIPEIRAAVVRMTKGELSPPIRSSNGWHIVRLTDRKPSSTRSLEEVHDSLVSSMRLRKAQDAERSYIEELLGKATVNINQAELQKLQMAIK
jgi:peptidylprolyl isomerase